MGHEADTGIVSDQPVPAPEYADQSDYYHNYYFYCKFTFIIIHDQTIVFVFFIPIDAEYIQYIVFILVNLK